MKSKDGLTLRDLYEITLSRAPSAFEAREIFRAATGTDPAVLLSNTPAPPEVQRRLFHLLDQRERGYPLQYLLGMWEFYSLPFFVGPGVLIPRQDTETLVDAALSVLKKSEQKTPELLDLCSGSGCVAIAVKHNFGAARVTALEACGKAFAFLEKNAALNAVDIACVHGDLRNYSHPRLADVIVSNPPYIPRSQLPELQEEVRHEPAIALDGGEDGLDFFRDIARLYRSQLAPCGTLLIEIGAGQGEGVESILGSFGFTGIREHKDLSGIVRVIEARK